MRIKVYCKPIAATSCAGTLKVRSLRKVRSGLTSAAKVDRVTFGSAEIQLPRRAVGYVKLPVERPKQQLLAQKLRSVPVVISATVIDGTGKRQVITRTVTLRG